MNLNCEEVKTRAERYAEKTLPREETDAVKRHINECAGCCVFIVGARKALRGEIPGMLKST